MSMLLPRHPGQRALFLEGRVSACTLLSEREATELDNMLRFLAVRV